MIGSADTGAFGMTFGGIWHDGARKIVPKSYNLFAPAPRNFCELAQCSTFKQLTTLWVLNTVYFVLCLKFYIHAVNDVFFSRHVRRFGYSDQTFTVEGGSRCGSGEGLFIFEKCSGREIMNEVTERMKAIPKTVAEESDIYSEVPATDEPSTYVDIGSKRITNLPQRPLPVSPPLGPPTSAISNLAQMVGAQGKKLTEAMANYKQVVVSKSTTYSGPIEDNPADTYEELPCDGLEEPPPPPVQSKPQPAPKSKAAAQPQQKTFNPPPAKSAKPKMSEVLKALSMQNARGQKPLDPEDQTYSQLDIKMEKVNRRESEKMDSNENLYGQQLIQHQNAGFDSTGDYTEISTGDKKGIGKR